MKRVLATALLAGALYAEDGAKKSGYDVEFTPSFNASVNLFSDNWDGGDLGSFTWSASADFKANKQLTDKVLHENWAKLLYGKTSVQLKDSTGDKEWSDMEKSADLIEAETVLKFTLGKFVDPFVSVKGESQFLDNSADNNVRRINPVTIKETFGASRNFVDEELLTFNGRFGAGARQHINKDHLDSLTGKAEWETTNDMGLELVLNLQAKNKKESMSYESTFELYEALLRNEGDVPFTDDQISDYRTPDVRWIHDLKLNVTKLVILSLQAEFLYDKEIVDEIRMRENLSVGVSYTFKNRK